MKNSNKEIYSDVHKDTRGFRPRGPLLPPVDATEADIEAMIEALEEEAEEKEA